jgi:hypothetical protein
VIGPEQRDQDGCKADGHDDAEHPVLKGDKRRKNLIDVSTYTHRICKVIDRLTPHLQLVNPTAVVISPVTKAKGT